ncbi:DUF7344 domain-containing protein [Halobellus limi]|uniref:DUF7344 domain-containing protein n=1 Tax=Halobellus limi TaxID=699433 RepID=A0A1H5TRX4_9EURY|nr:hypothetical protein [Halobellus limi]QCC47247.1 hypothetical protein DV707_05940 [Halobellus limi]SEF65543.1 hypothetical protein SAMN04488133_0362 [Halobellus limi]
MGQRAATELTTDDGTGDGAEERLPKDEIFDLMGNHRRRYAIHYCKQTDGPVELSDLAEQVAAWEHDKQIEEVTSAERKTVYTSLQQTHLPRLDRAGVIEFENGTVELTDRVDRLDIYLDIVPESSIPWSVYYLGLSLISSLILVALWVDFLPTEQLPVLAYPTVLIALFTVSAAYHVYANRQNRFENLDRPP